MAQPPAYNKSTNFANYAAANPSAPFPAASTDSEFSAVETTLDAINTNLALIQRDDGLLRNASVHQDSFSTAALALIAGTWTPRGLWVTATAYVVGDVVEESGSSYVCAVAHTSGTFATDDAAGKWVELSVYATAFARTILDDADASTVLTTLGFSTFIKTLIDDTTAAAALATLGYGVVAEETATGTEVDFPDIPAGVGAIEVMFSGLSTSGTNDIIIQLAHPGGLETSGYTPTASGFLLLNSPLAADTHSGMAVLRLQNPAAFRWVNNSILFRSSDGANYARSGIKTMAAEIDHVRVTTVGGTDTFDGGTISLRYGP